MVYYGEYTHGGIDTYSQRRTMGEMESHVRASTQWRHKKRSERMSGKNIHLNTGGRHVVKVVIKQLEPITKRQKTPSNFVGCHACHKSFPGSAYLNKYSYISK